MSTFAIGDIQGCLQPLLTLLHQVGFHRRRDRLWLVGDLVNRGPRSLDTLRFVRDLGERAVVVLGNHDLHLLAVAAGVASTAPRDTLDEVLQAPDRNELTDWLRRCPLLHAEGGFAMVHAGIPPPWNLEQARSRAKEVEDVLRGSGHRDYLSHMYGDEPDQWSDTLEDWGRLRYITNALTRMRYCRPDGSLDLRSKGPPGTHTPDLLPWFAVPSRRTRRDAIIIGHWGTLQLVRPLDPRHNVFHLETGCAFGARLTAMRLEDRKQFSVPCADTGRRSHWRPPPGHALPGVQHPKPCEPNTWTQTQGRCDG